MTISFPWQMGGGIQMPVDEEITGALIKNQTYAIAYGVNESPDLAHCLRSGASRADKHESTTYVAQPMAVGFGGEVARALTARHDSSPCADRGMDVIAVAQPVPYDFYQITAPVNRQNREPGDPCHTLARDNAAHATIVQPMQVRRLTPRECERLQGFPDDYTLISYRNKPSSDGPRYKALGNSMAVPVMRWIGKRIQMVEDLE